MPRVARRLLIGMRSFSCLFPSTLLHARYNGIAKAGTTICSFLLTVKEIVKTDVKYSCLS